ncbi:uncharacterized protein LOC127094647 [Lathyrus oleraceus]|uniref:uncharacterized protein LOC127094647 n=1 Tax=Pisum sativum TaxID=3888 RepID=UPI0021D04585|nr:uncharacterized protein LOC127094647 [Pisum sativum]
MAEQEQESARVRAELDEIKGGMSQMREMLQALTFRFEIPQATVISETTGPAVEVPPQRTLPSTLPPYGLPYDFVPRAEVVHEMGQSVQQAVPLPVYTDARPVIHTVVPPAAYARHAPHYEDQNHMYQTVDSTVAGDEVRFEDFIEVKENMQLLEKKFRDLEGDHVFGSAAKEMCLVSGLVIPAKFKTPDFDKYKGHTCPKSHLIMYYRKMAAHVEDDKLMIHCFQDILSGAPSKWYISLDQNRIMCFQDLSDAFIKHYKYNMDMAPDRRQLQSMFQHDKESFKEYAQRWRELASQVEPPLAEKELAELFIDTVQPQFYEKMVGSASLGFSELVAIGARVEYGVRNGKLAAVAGTSNANPKKFSGGFPRKKEGETNVVTAGQGRAPPRRRPQQYPPQQYVQQPIPYQQPMYPVQYAPQPYVYAVTPAFNQQPAQAYQAPPVYRPAPVQQRAAAPPAYQQAPATPVYQQPRAQAPRQNAQNQNMRQGERATFNPIPMSYTELYPSLLQKGLVVPRPMGPPPDRLPPWYNPNAHCPFHEGAPGHDLESCYALKHRVRELIESKILSFKDMGPNVKNNPLPPHGDPTVNAIEDASTVVMVEKVDDVKTPLAAFHARLVEAGLINVNHDNCEECATYPKGCQVVRDNIQDLMDKGVLQISSAVKNEDGLVIEPCFNLPEPVEIPYYSRRVASENSHPSPVEICMPAPFPYESTKVVPWKYEITVMDKVVEGSADAEVTEAVSEDVTNIAGMSRMTRSGRTYTPEFNVTPQGPDKESTVVTPTKEPEVVQSEDAVEFLKLIKKSDYKVVDQLHQTPSKISILSLLLNSQAHREALLKVLAQDHVTQSITVDQFDGVVANITACNTLSFSGEELPEDGQNHNRALHISVKCKDDALDPVGKACSSFASLKSAKSSNEGGNPEGWGQLIDIREKHDRFGLGYVPSAVKGARVPTKDNTRSIQEDMPGLDTDIIEHKLPLQPDCPPVTQKLRRTRPDMALKIREEVKRQFDAGFLAVAKYPQWLANIVPVPKKDGKVTPWQWSGCDGDDESDGIRFKLEDGFLARHHTKVEGGRKVYWSAQEGVISCSCHQFEFSGILCRHSLRVLSTGNCFQIPDTYLPIRWRRISMPSSRFLQNASAVVTQNSG